MTLRGNPFAPDAGQSFGATRRDMPSVEYAHIEALRDGAENLLNKALEALEAGDEARANRFVTKACSLPYDEREEHHPGPDVANFLAYLFLADVADAAGTKDAWGGRSDDRARRDARRRGAGGSHQQPLRRDARGSIPDVRGHHGPHS